MTDDNDALVTTSHWFRESRLETRFLAHSGILYSGNWNTFPDREDCHSSNSQFSAFEFAFRGSSVRWIGSRDTHHGLADVHIDGVFVETVDNYSPVHRPSVVKFSTNELAGERTHVLRVVVRKERNSVTTDCYQDVSEIESLTPLSYPVEIAKCMALEYEAIQNGTRPLRPDGRPGHDGAAM